MTHYLIPLLVTSMILTTVAADDECGHGLVKAVKKHIVNDDPFSIYGGVLANAYVQEKETLSAQCSYSSYFQLPDGSVQEEAFFYDLAGNKKKVGIEIIKKTEKNGELTLWGLDTDSQKYHGNTYVFYADEDVLGFYSCMPGGNMWNMNIQVRTKEGLQSKTPNAVKTSLQKAKDTMDLILNEGKDVEGVVMVQSNLEKLCFE